MSRDDSNCDDSNVLNSSFYSSTSINTFDHAKMFRNSMLLADLDEPYSDGALPVSQSSEDVENNAGYPESLKKDREIATMKMSTSPSLSALAGILNEKSRQANEKLRSSTIIDTSIMEEEVSGEVVSQNEDPSTGAADASPNLFELNDDEEVYCPQSSLQNVSELSAQPDFLSTPKITNELEVAQEPPHQSQEEPMLRSRRVISEAPKNSVIPSDVNIPTAKRTVSAGVPANQGSNSKKKNFFSFLRKRHTGDNQDAIGSSPTIPNSTTFSLGSTRASQSPSEKLTRKSHSSSNIFSTFRKNKEAKNRDETANFTRSETKNPSEVPKTTSKVEHMQKSMNKPLPKKNISSRKPTPLSFEHSENDRNSTKKVPESPKGIPDSAQQVFSPPSDASITRGEVLDHQNNVTEYPVETSGFTNVGIESSKQDKSFNQIEERPLTLPTKLDSGEAVFPKSLDVQEVDSIVSLERSRSAKSNKRSSIASHRRSLTETLSVNAQNEGMFVMEASSVVLSTPDLGKSPASSILRNGKFDATDFSSNHSNVQEESIDLNRLSSDEPSLRLNSVDNQNLMGSIEAKLHDMMIDPEADVTPVEEKPTGERLDDDPEFMSDIMEFASIINFGEGVNFDFDSNLMEPKSATLEPTAILNQEYPAKNKSYHGDTSLAPAGLGITCDTTEREVIQQPKVPLDEIRDEDFENEDFNNLYEAGHEASQDTPRLRAYIPELDTQRPISMSFRGLKAPSFNASVTGSSITDSYTKADHMSFASTERRVPNNVIFSSKIILYDTYSEEEYDRRPDVATCNQLTPQLAQLIKAELNELKSDMEVHEESRCYTHFF